MKPFDFIDSVYVTTSLKQNHTPYDQSKLSALRSFRSLQGVVLQFVSYFDLIGTYLLVVTGIKPALKSAQEIVTELYTSKIKSEKEKADQVASGTTAPTNVLTLVPEITDVTTKPCPVIKTLEERRVEEAKEFKKV